MRLYTLKEVFRKEVLDHPAVQELTSATRPDERLQAMLHRGWYTSVCRYWPSTADDRLRKTAAGDSPLGILYKNTRPTPEVAAALKAIADRYSAVFAPLRSGLVVARGHLITGQSEVINAGIWSHPKFWIDFVNGDGGKLAEPVENTIAILFEAEWTAVSVAAASSAWSEKSASRDFRKKKKAATIGVEKAVKALWPDGNIEGLSVKDRNRKINSWLAQNELTLVSDSTIKRFFAHRN